MKPDLVIIITWYFQLSKLHLHQKNLENSFIATLKLYFMKENEKWKMT